MFHSLDRGSPELSRLGHSRSVWFKKYSELGGGIEARETETEGQRQSERPRVSTVAIGLFRTLSHGGWFRKSSSQEAVRVKCTPKPVLGDCVNASYFGSIYQQ